MTTETASLYDRARRAHPEARFPLETFTRTQPLDELARALWPDEPRPVSVLAHAAQVKGPGDTRACLEQFTPDEQRRMRQRATILIYRRA